MEKIRTFIAIELPDEVKKTLKTLQEELKKHAENASWSRPETTHLTLKFLGEIDSDRIEEITEGLKKAVENIKAFEVQIRGIGGFPSRENPRVLWVGLDESQGLRLLYENIEERMASLGFKREKRGFKPHLTLCRVKNPQDGKRLSEGVRGLKKEVSVSFPVEGIVFFKSELKPSGALHTPLERIGLKGR